MGALLGAFIGLVIGASLSYYVWRLDVQKVELGLRPRPQYRLSLWGVPLILMIVGALIGTAIT